MADCIFLSLSPFVRRQGAEEEKGREGKFMASGRENGRTVRINNTEVQKKKETIGCVSGVAGKRDKTKRNQVLDNSNLFFMKKILNV